ncbi:hypothetical protein ACGFMK_26665 [Amycolatopsis sp. NPDC049252]|uniref:hypothetical protein n=1 Tax=Amycolatopsis sp. NPDC049252 TaxID=3363933 RepID=UPI0037196C8B
MPPCTSRSCPTAGWSPTSRRCDPGGFSQELEIPHEQWDAFDPWHPAGTPAPGERPVLMVSGKVPERASYFGRTGLGCHVYGDQGDSGPYTFAGARVPGKKADAKGQVWVDKNHNGQLDAGEGPGEDEGRADADRRQRARYLQPGRRRGVRLRLPRSGDRRELRPVAAR